jgi:hypothetical protein
MRNSAIIACFVSSGLLLCVHAGASPIIFSVGGDNTTASIQATVDAFRTAVGNPNNLNNAGPILGGRREINWDGGGGVSATTPPVTPFNTFLNRGAQFTTPGTGLTQATPDGLGVLVNNRLMEPISAPSARCACSPRSEAISPTVSFPSPEATP